jgi:phytoene desaturase (3,4-didehydrolycopene-forming)
MYIYQQYLEIVEGVWYPIGGFRRVLDGLVACVRGLGVDIRCSSQVKRINTE